MGVVRVLDAAVADQIAAGEVVERPASVVKELLENALDAGATRVDVDVVEGGLGRLSVVDDGSGMDDDDAVLCFSRHATSKLTLASDLRSMGTFGFRGEALAAISSVAKVRLLTRKHSSPRAFAVDVEGGRITGVGEAGGPAGTRVDVVDLFFNVPARKKFLKTLRTEAGHVEDALLSAALCKPALALRLNVDGKVVLDLPAVAAGAALDDAASLDRVVRCLGKHVRPHLFPVRGATDLLTLTGYVVAPLETRRDLAGVHLSVNGRPVSDRNLVQAVRAAFRTLLEVGRQPIVSLDLALDKELVDVNVHPRKAEVRFADPRRVSGHLIALLSEFLVTTPWLDPKRGSSYSLGLVPPPTPNSEVADLHRDRVRDALARFSARNATSSMTAVADRGPMLPTLTSSPGRGGASSFAMLRVVGQVGATYLVLEGPQGMVVIDQHAAHERVVFERLKAGRAAGGTNARAQPLLLPLTIELSPTERAAVDDDDVRAELLSHGIEIEGFSGSTALVRSLPPGLDGRKAAAIVRDALAELSSSGRTGALDERSDAVCARLACHAAIRAGDVLAAVQVRALLVDLDAIDLGAHCPHGRPVVRTLDYTELADWFDRD
ncbi:MAG: DNA mismatch repair endonuclease MutL [Deltaproteobacteria bacterium]|nr:DNA mismatch repair endonuclease MutL [Deltaproteobacteria bacterium]